MSHILKKIDEYYTEKLLTHGPTPAGVDWNGEEGQHLRFTQLLKIILHKEPFTLTDLGCGYAQLYAFIIANGYNSFSYTGIDISKEMIQQSEHLYNKSENCQFLVGSACTEPTDYCVASGLFNVKLDNSVEQWESFIIETLENINTFSKKGFSCNFLTSYSDKHLMKDYLYYADPSFYFDYCKKNLSRNVALLHDYGLYEFTLLVRK
jgi:SAM-dependent methyltransferase